MEGRNHKILIARFSFFIVISTILLIGLIWGSTIQSMTLPQIPVLLIFFGITWGAILAFVVFEKLVQI